MTDPIIDKFYALDMPSVAFVLSEVGVIEHANQLAAEFWERPIMELRGKSVLELAHHETFGMGAVIIRQLASGDIDRYSLMPYSKWHDRSGHVKEGKWFLSRVIVDGETKIFGSIVPVQDDEKDEPDYVAFGLSGRWWRGVKDLIQRLDVWKLLIVVAGLIAALWILQDYLPLLGG